MVEAKREVEATVDEYRTSPNFSAKMARIVAAIQVSKEIFNAYVAFSHEAFGKGQELGGLIAEIKLLSAT